MVVIPDEILHGSAAGCEGEERSHMEAFVVDRAKEALDFTVRLRRIGPQEMMRNTETLTGLLKARPAIGMKRVAHRECKRVVRQHRFNRVRQVAATRSRNVVAATLVCSVVIHTTASRLKSSTAANSKSLRAFLQRRQIFQVDVNAVRLGAVFRTVAASPRRPRQSIDAMALRAGVAPCHSPGPARARSTRHCVAAPAVADAPNHRRRRVASASRAAGDSVCAKPAMSSSA